MKPLLLLSSLLASSALGFNLSTKVYGKPVGFTYSVTGGGNATPAVPANGAQLLDWLTDSKPRVIVLDKETPVDCTYPNTTTIDVASNKIIVGLGAKGFIRGSGLRLVNGASNVIIQNIHLTDINLGYIWGGDAIYMNGCDLIWIDHVKISLVDRQMISMGYESGGRVTISNTEFDGRTDHFATPGFRERLAHFQQLLVQQYRTCFSVTPEPAILLEGNIFHDVARPTEPGNGYGMFITNSSTVTTCDSAMKRPCQENLLTGSGDLSPYTTNNVTSLQTIADADEQNINIMPVSQVRAYVLANAGIGKVGFNSTVTPTVSPSSSVMTPPATVAPYQVHKDNSHGHQYLRFHHRRP
ncbi:hypothetical protein G4B11_006030 [Aspergillus flavus]|nr:hypothetical protein G4B11_006030 [Aspergillus flavus]